jgi:hypothetical protein
MGKDWYKSKLIWLGVLQILVSVSEFIAGVPAGTSVITIISGILTIVLRIVTKQTVSGAPASEVKLNWLGRAYAKIWYFTEGLWIKSGKLRRPFTYMMRDFMMAHPAWTVIIVIAENIGLMFLVRWNWIGGFFTISFYWLLMGHLRWGTPMKKGEQEDPEYTGQ